MEIQTVAEKALSLSKQMGAEKTLVSASYIEAKEFNIEANRMTLLRTTYDQNLGFKTLIGNRQSSVGGNQFSDEAMRDSLSSVLLATKASQEDAGNGFAPAQGHKSFSHGKTPINEVWMHSVLTDLLESRAKRFPHIIIDGGTIKFIKTQKVLATSEGTFLTNEQGHYEGFIMFTSKLLKQTSSFNYTSFNIASDHDKQKLSLLDVSHLAELFKQSGDQINTKKIPAKFEGDLIVTPHCLEHLIGEWNGFLGSGQMLKRSSIFENKLDQKVASEKWTLYSQPVESDFASRNFWTSDGYVARNETLFENGVLKSYLLNHYAAKKLNQKVSLSQGQYLKASPGNKKLSEMISSVKKGVLMCRYSSGRPAENGEISGVAKNSYYIEDGEIKYPLGETMVSTNLASLLYNIEDVSSETVRTGYSELPWIKCSGVSVS